MDHVTALHLLPALDNQNVTMLIIALFRGADPNTRNEHGQTALMIAIQTENQNLIRPLLKEGADPYLEDSNGYNAFNYAKYYHVDLETYSKRIDPVIIDPNTGITNLMIMVANGTNIYHYLVGDEVDTNKVPPLSLDLINHPDEKGNTALTYAASSNQEDAVDLLLLGGANRYGGQVIDYTQNQTIRDMLLRTYVPLPDLNLIDLLKSYMGLFTTTEWGIGKRYLKECNKTCTDPTGRYMLVPKVGESTTDCIEWDNKYSPSDCVGFFVPKAKVFNRYDNENYTLIREIRCLASCMKASYIYQKGDVYYCLLNVGDILQKDEHVLYFFQAMRFILEYLRHYIRADKRLVFFGHSAGIVNAFIIAQVLAMDIADLERLYSEKDKIVCNVNPFNGNNVITSFGDKFDCKPEMGKILSMFRRLKEEKEEILRNNISFIGSGGHRYFDDTICSYAQVHDYFKHKIIHFGLMETYADLQRHVGDRKAYDGYLIKYPPDYNVPTFGLHYDVTLFQRAPVNKLTDASFITELKTDNGTDRLHAFHRYRDILEQALKRPDILARLNNYYQHGGQYTIYKVGQ